MDNIFVVFISCQDEEEFPGLTLALTGTDKFINSSNAAKLHSEVNVISYFSAQMYWHIYDIILFAKTMLFFFLRKTKEKVFSICLLIQPRKNHPQQKLSPW